MTGEIPEVRSDKRRTAASAAAIATVTATENVQRILRVLIISNLHSILKEKN